jgi:hypothetical protein
VGGCSNEGCSAEEGGSSTCEADDWPGQGGACGCVDKQCIWYRDEAAEPPGEPTPAPEPTPPGPPQPLQGQGLPCDAAGKCGGGLTCLSYFGIAGPQGPTFTSCEIPCMNAPESCPQGQQCITIADGPGQVCRPRE